jgi:hypothetical protein
VDDRLKLDLLVRPGTIIIITIKHGSSIKYWQHPIPISRNMVTFFCTSSPTRLLTLYICFPHFLCVKNDPIPEKRRPDLLLNNEFKNSLITFFSSLLLVILVIATLNSWWFFARFDDFILKTIPRTTASFFSSKKDNWMPRHTTTAILTLVKVGSTDFLPTQIVDIDLQLFTLLTRTK